jgi:hypothetical protein
MPTQKRRKNSLQEEGNVMQNIASKQAPRVSRKAKEPLYVKQLNEPRRTGLLTNGHFDATTHTNDVQSLGNCVKAGSEYLACWLRNGDQHVVDAFALASPCLDLGVPV